ncbi:MAG: hypothetical protein WC248_07835 [Candidatus Methanomethylophilaceae archaeon]|jgi:hypothetical protein
MQRILTVVAVLLIFTGFMIALIGRMQYDDAYKQGQIDALTGKICYKLEQQQDGTTIWIKIKEQHEPLLYNRTAK